MRTDAPEKRTGLTVAGLEKRFGSVTAVQDLSLAVKDGELLAIVGPSGCGKTTLLRIIAGLERPDQGRVFIQGKDVTSLPPERRDVGFVFQQFALFPNMTVAANVEYGLKRKRVPAPERARRVAEMLSMVGLRGLERRRPDQLSAGQQQRVALARALAPRPNTLLLDEPLSALDAAIRERLREELRETQRRLGITTILVTHDQEEAMAIADRVAVMNDGRLEQVGTPWELYHQPRTRFVAGFIGRGNFLSGQVDAAGALFPGLGRIPNDVFSELLNSEDGELLDDQLGADGSELPLAVSSGSVVALVRPEAVIIETPGGGTSGDWTADLGRHRGALSFSAAIVDVTFGGERSTVRLALDGDRGDGAGDDTGGRASDDSFDHSLAAHELIATVGSEEVRRLARRVGERVSVSIPWVALRLLPSE